MPFTSVREQHLWYEVWPGLDHPVQLQAPERFLPRVLSFAQDVR